MRGCNYPNCPNVHRARGYCGTHYYLFSKYGNFDRRRAGSLEIQRFIDSVVTGRMGCIEWPYRTTWNGYASVGKGGKTFW